MAVALGLIIAIILLKYKPIYKVTLLGQEIGYVDNEAKLKDRIQQEIIEMQGKNIDFVTLDDMPNYEFKLVNRNQKTNEEEIMLALKENARIMYKYYAVILNNETVGLVDNMEEAEQAITQIKEEHKEDTVNLELSVIENYTENINDISIETVQVAQAQMEEKVSALVAEEQAKKEEEEKSKYPNINGVLLAVTPVSGSITSRFGVVSSIRSGAHTGTDIAAETGTKITSSTEGTVILASSTGDYGKHLKIQTNDKDIIVVYAHCNNLYVNEGDSIKQGQEIAEVGSTGNATGPHLHFEIRYQERYVDPQLILEL